MKRLAGALGVTWFCLAAWGAPGNILENGSFAAGSKDWGDSSLIDEAEFVPAPDKNTKSLKIVSDHNWSGAAKSMLFAPDMDYTVTVWMKSENSAATHVKVVWRTAGNFKVEDAFPFAGEQVSNKWRKFSAVIHAPKHAESGTIFLMGGADEGKIGTSWFDEISIVPADEALHTRMTDKFQCAEAFHPALNALKPVGEAVLLKDWNKRSVVIPADADGQCVYAAKMLSAMLGRIFACEIPVVRDDAEVAAPMISLGNTRFAQAAGIAGHPERQGYVIAVKGDTLYLRGSRSGDLYAVLALLAEDFGCRFYAAPEPMQFVPAASPDFAVVPRSYAPEFEIREPFPGQFFANDTFNAFNRVQAVSFFKNIPRQMGGGMSNVEYFIHTYDRLIPAAKYFDAHPDYFPLRGGKRVPSAPNSGQLCYTNPEVADVMAEELKEVIADNPGTTIYSVSQNDNTAVECECARCQAVPDGVPGAALMLANRVAERLAETVPDVRITTLAYVGTQPVPQAVNPADNTVIFYAPIRERVGALASVPWQDVPKIVAEAEGWSRIAKHLYAWDYAISEDMLPVLDVLDRNVEFWRTHHFTGIFIEDNEFGLNSLAPLKNWVMMQKLWNPAWKLDDLIEDYVAGHYGTAAPEMRAAVNLSRTRWQEFYKNYEPGKSFRFSKADFAKFNELFAAAYAKNLSDEIAGEIIACNAMQLKSCRKNEAKEYAKRLEETLHLIEKHGIYLHSKFKSEHDAKIAAWKETLADAESGESFPVVSENSVILKKPQFWHPAKGIKAEGSYMSEAGQVFGKQDWLIQWEFSKLLNSVENQTFVVARIRIRPELKNEYPADKDICGLYLWRSGFPPGTEQGRYLKYSELKNHEWQTVDIFKVYMYSPAVTGCFYDVAGDLAEGDSILYDLIEFIPAEDYPDKSAADKLPTIEL